MATHSSILAWEIPWTEEPGGLQFMGSPRVKHNLATKHQTFILLNFKMQSKVCILRIFSGLTMLRKDFFPSLPLLHGITFMNF